MKEATAGYDQRGDERNFGLLRSVSTITVRPKDRNDTIIYVTGYGLDVESATEADGIKFS